MSKKSNQLEQFITLRLEGKSYDECATELKVNRSTLIGWAKELDIKTQIKVSQFTKIEALIKQNELGIQQRLNGQIKFLKKINDELANRDLKDLSTDKLFDLANKVSYSINSMLPIIEYREYEDFTPDYRNEIVYQLRPTE